MAFAVVVPIGIVTYLAAFRPGTLNDHDDLFVDVNKFRNRISRDWWEIIAGDESPAISYVTISPVSGFQIAKINGDAYRKSGEYWAHWESEGACVNLEERWIFYKWRGQIPSGSSAEHATGAGEIAFDPSYRSGHGHFLEIRLTRPGNLTHTKVTHYFPATRSERSRMERRRSKEAEELVSKKLGDLRRLAAVEGRPL
jgi:hypothetical protein